MGEISEDHYQRFAEDYAYDVPDIFHNPDDRLSNKSAMNLVRLTGVKCIEHSEGRCLYESEEGRRAWIPTDAHVYSPLDAEESGHIVIYESYLTGIKFSESPDSKGTPK